MKPFIDLTAIHRRMAPKEKLTAIEEWHRIERQQTLITASVIVLAMLGAVIMFCVLTP